MGTLNFRCRIILRTQKGTITLTITHILAHGMVSDLVAGEFAPTVGNAKSRVLGLGPKAAVWLLGPNKYLYYFGVPCYEYSIIYPKTLF